MDSHEGSFPDPDNVQAVSAWESRERMLVAQVKEVPKNVTRGSGQYAGCYSAPGYRVS